MKKTKLTTETRSALFESGMSVLSLYQIPQRDGRKLDRCAQPSDPWHASLYNGGRFLFATKLLHGKGATADDAIFDALGSDYRLEREIDNLLAVLRALR